MAAIRILPGRPYPLGATVEPGGVNFSVFSANATAVEFLLFDRYDQQEPTAVISLDPHVNKTYYYWHHFVPGIGAGQIYAYRVYGPYEPEKGYRFNGHKVLLEPYTRCVAYGDNWRRADARGFQSNTASAMKSVVIDFSYYDWEGDEPLQRPISETVIYEVHVRGFTAHPSSGVAFPGTYRGFIEKIPYLKSLGITAVELLPVQQFDEQEVERINPLTGEPLKNYWGYAPVAFFAPHRGYAQGCDVRAAVDEFRDLVKALHRAGIEVILDVVFNHTAEGDETGPTISFRGFENIAYYMLKEDRRYYRDYTGTGNTINGNHSVVRRMIRDCLRHWVLNYHVDGFRFDLASVLSRDQSGRPVTDSPILWEVESDPVLAGTKLIAEAWDASGLYQLGQFTGGRWAEWNGRFRDDVRRFIRGDEDPVRDLAWRLTGSFDIIRKKEGYISPHSINYVTCHDGFTLNDLVSYSQKHNWANGEQNQDGIDENYSCNWGVEGPTDDPVVLALRQRQIKNFFTLLFFARGTPMILGGDEMGRTQLGNNNAYCQDNEISWYNWDLLKENEGLGRFVRELIKIRRCHRTLTRAYRLDGRPCEASLQDGVTFHGVELYRPDWRTCSHSLAMHLHGVDDDVGFYLIANAYHKPLTFQIPYEVRWRRLIDTSLPSPQDLVSEFEARALETCTYRVEAYSVVVLIEDGGMPKREG